MISTQFLQRVSLRTDIEPAALESYPLSLPALQGLKDLLFHAKVTYFVGENGSGKSTLLEALAVSLGFNAEGGSRNFRFDTRATHSNLHNHLRVAKGVRKPSNGYFLRAESFYNMASEIERLDAEPAFGPPVVEAYGGRSLHAQSHGEAFLSLMLKRFGPKGLYLLDEPEAALSPQRQLAVLARIHELVHQGSQFVIATHSPILMAYPDATLYSFSNLGIQQTAYEDTEHFLVTRDFLRDPQRMMSMLFGETRPTD